MSRTEEIQKEIDQYADARRTCEKAKNEFTALIARLVKEKADVGAEKPELGHGDFGVDGEPYVVVSQSTLPGSPKAIFASSMGLIKADENMSPDTRFGNIFKITKGWGEDFEEEWESKPAYKNAIQIIIKVMFNGIFFGNSRNGATFDLENITEIWRKLGHAIMTLKKKQQK